MAHRLAAAAFLAAVPSLAAADDEGRKLFTGVTPACSVCHALKDAGATGAVGPSLDELKPDAARVRQALKTGIGQMPAFTHLTPAQIETLARYVADAAK